MNYISIDSTDAILIGSLALCFFIQLFYYLYFYAKPLRYQNKINKNKMQEQTASTGNDSFPGVSVIISSQNESQNLSKFLPSILEQDYENFEVIVINDNSTDESDDILRQLEQKYSNLYGTYIPEGTKNVCHKKLALTVGIKAAKHDILLFTEANNQPLSKNWIKSMVENFDEKTEFVLGFSRINRFGLIAKFAEFDNLLIGLKYLSRAIMKRPYMGVGTNLAYRKQLFFEKKGFRKLNLQFGEDDLFVNEFANRTNTKIEISQEAITQSNIDSFKIWKDIKRCRQVTQSYYKGFENSLWRIEFLSRFLFWGLTAVTIFLFWETTYIPIFAGLLFFIKFIIQYAVMNKSAKLLLVKPFRFSLLLFDLLQPAFNIYCYFYRMFRRKNDYV